MEKELTVREQLANLTARQKIVYPFSVLLSIVITIVIVLNREQVNILREVNFPVFMIISVFATIGHIINYLIFGGLMEYANPKPIDEERRNLLKAEITRGSQILVIITFSMTFYFRYLEVNMPFYGYFDNITLTWWQAILNIIIFMWLCDTWFYWSHRLLHHPFLWTYIHYYHHSFIDTTAFSQIAVHYVEGFIHGPMVYIMPHFVFPIHPAIGILVGFPTGMFAIMAHDGEILDTNSHTKHHIYKGEESNENEIRGVNYSLYWRFWDDLCGTSYNPKTSKKWYKKSTSKPQNVKDKTN